jgi:hypothetical protein
MFLFNQGHFRFPRAADLNAFRRRPQILSDELYALDIFDPISIPSSIDRRAPPLRHKALSRKTSAVRLLVLPPFGAVGRAASIDQLTKIPHRISYSGVERAARTQVNDGTASDSFCCATPRMSFSILPITFPLWFPG